MSMFRSVLGQHSFGLSRLIGLFSTEIPSLHKAASVSVGISLGWPWSWSGILHAAPKKRTSHQKKRQRQLAGNNQQRPLNSLNRCPACGHVKRAHTLCMNCVQEIRRAWRMRDRQDMEAKKDAKQFYDPSTLSSKDTEFNYPKRINRPSEYQEKLADRGSYILSRPKTLEARPKLPKQKKLPQLLRKGYE